MLHWGASLLLVPYSDRQFSVAGRNGRVYDVHGRGPPHVLNIYLNNPPWPENEGVPNWQGHQAVPIPATHRSKPTQRNVYILSVCASVREGQGNHEGVNPATPLRVRPPGKPRGGCPSTPPLLKPIIRDSTPNKTRPPFLYYIKVAA
jgi:hypothetical protein